MNRPGVLLLALMGGVPVIVILAVGVAVLLFRSGYGYFVSFGVPFVVSMALISVLGVVLGRAAHRSRNRPPGDG